jgi:sugar lactone lactonase YvrE
MTLPTPKYCAGASFRRLLFGLGSSFLLFCLSLGCGLVFSCDLFNVVVIDSDYNEYVVSTYVEKQGYGVLYATDVSLDRSGNLYVSIDGYYNKGVIKRTPDGETSLLRHFPFQIWPTSICVDDGGNCYAGDWNYNGIFKIIPGGSPSFFAGGRSEPPNYYLDAQGCDARFNFITDVVEDSNGNIYVADAGNHCIRKLTISNGQVTTFAGGSEVGYVDGPRLTATFNAPWSIAIDGIGNIYVADSGNHRIRKITMSSGEVTTVAGSSPGFNDGDAAEAQFDSPRGVAVESAGILYVSDTMNHRIRKIANGKVTTIAGSSRGNDNGSGDMAKFYSPHGITVDKVGNIFVADTSNYVVRKLEPLR